MKNNTLANSTNEERSTLKPIPSSAFGAYASEEVTIDLGTAEQSSQSPVFSGTGGRKIPPHSLDAEQSVLGAVLLDNEAINPILEVLRVEDFYYMSHQSIFNAMYQLSESRKPVDIITLTDQLKSTSELDLVGGVEYLSKLVDIVPTSANAQFYARIIKATSLRRRLIHTVSGIAEEAFSMEGDVDGFLDSVEQRIFQISESRVHQGFHKVSSVIQESIKQVERRYVLKEPITGVASGFRDLDALTSGFQPSDLIIIAGRPAMGKTSLALSMGLNVALESHKPIAIFSLEMSKEQITMRMMCSVAHVSNSKARSGKLGDNDFPKLVDAAAKLAQADIYIDDTPAISVLEMRAKARRLHRENPLSLVIIDYLQLMRGSSRRSERREQEISEISAALKALAKELSIPVIALSQLNRAVETRQDKRPMMADLRESGAIEQDADLIGFVYRDEVYNPDTADKGVAELILSKHRNGSIGTVKMTFMSEFTRFESFSEEEGNYDYLGPDMNLGGLDDETLL